MGAIAHDASPRQTSTRIKKQSQHFLANAFRVKQMNRTMWVGIPHTERFLFLFTSRPPPLASAVCIYNPYVSGCGGFSEGRRDGVDH